MAGDGHRRVLTELRLGQIIGAMVEQLPKLSTVRLLVAWLIFPTVLGGALVAAAHLMNHGYDPVHVLTGLSFSAAFIIIAFERIQPYSQSWNQQYGDVKTDSIHLVISTMLVPKLLDIAILGVLASGAAWLSASLGTDLWPTTWPLWTQIALALVIGEFGQYWLHRFAHETDLLWRLHATHHSAERL